MWERGDQKPAALQVHREDACSCHIERITIFLTWCRGVYLFWDESSLWKPWCCRCSSASRLITSVHKHQQPAVSHLLQQMHTRDAHLCWEICVHGQQWAAIKAFRMTNSMPLSLLRVLLWFIARLRAACQVAESRHPSIESREYLKHCQERLEVILLCECAHQLCRSSSWVFKAQAQGRNQD